MHKYYTWHRCLPISLQWVVTSNGSQVTVAFFDTTTCLQIFPGETLWLSLLYGGWNLGTNMCTNRQYNSQNEMLVLSGALAVLTWAKPSCIHQQFLLHLVKVCPICPDAAMALNSYIKMGEHLWNRTWAYLLGKVPNEILHVWKTRNATFISYIVVPSQNNRWYHAKKQGSGREKTTHKDLWEKHWLFSHDCIFETCTMNTTLFLQGLLLIIIKFMESRVYEIFINFFTNTRLINTHPSSMCVPCVSL